ncbi:NADP-dependent oxidoreductase [Nocardia macrotermitis]|uniref:Mycocerosic acid synthase n=1 Tax=Nocardia macrotermitis TaxID=2585198 RepID=A0A7K0DEA2_9NOCA|nr:NADP-dependent oxidoreductase [Nocardia macrotermitis]MQY23969.1 Mycocerosic acid synthase [Nocardia macrotermitis]
MTDQTTATMRAVRFHEYGEADTVLRCETVPVPEPGPGRIRVAVHACGLAPADWALCGGLFAGALPRGIGIDVSGTVDAVGAEVTGVEIGDLVVGNADWREASSAGAADYAIMDRWTPVPAGLDPVRAAALPMAVDTANLHLTLLGIDPDKTILIHGAGSTIGYAATQIALVRGMRVIATAGPTHAQGLRGLGAEVTSYGDGMVERVRDIADGTVDLVLDTSPVGGALPDLIRIAGDPTHVLTCGGSLPEAAELGARDSFREPRLERVDVLPEFAQLAAAGRFGIPIAGTFPLAEFGKALEISRGGSARGKLLLIPEENGNN